MVAAAAGDRSLVARLLAAGAAVERRNDKGASALLYAAHRGHRGVVEALLAAGAEVDGAAGNGWTALTLAAATGRAGTVRVLLANGADPNHPDIYDWTPLMRAVDNGHEQAARHLLADPRTEPNRRDEAGMTALHHATRHRDRDLARTLVRHCADVTAADRNGLTPVDILRARWGDPGEWLRAAAGEADCRHGVARAPR